jgi:excisionase family DNA binding protein
MLSYSIDEWCRLHGLSRAFFYKLKERGEAPATFQVGRLVRISEDANRYWMAQKEAEANRDG